MARSPSRTPLRTAVALLVFTILLGTVGYVVLEGWNIGDAAWMTIISISTVGFGEIRPLSAGGRILTSIIIVSGLTSVAFAGGQAVQVIADRTSQRRVRTMRAISRMRDHTIVCGFGRMGREVCQNLADENHGFVVVERDPALEPELQELGYRYVIGDASEDAVLQDAGIDRARGLVAIVSSDAENVFATLTAKALNPQLTVVARAVAEMTEHKLRTAGADRVIKPYELVSRRISQLVVRPSIVEFVDTIARSGDRDITLEEIMVADGSQLVGKALRDSPIRSGLNIIVVAIRRSTGELAYNPGPDAAINSGDALIAIGPPQDLLQLTRMCGG